MGHYLEQNTARQRLGGDNETREQPVRKPLFAHVQVGAQRAALNRGDCHRGGP